MQNQTNAKTYKILSLDGGGAKGFYTLGVLQEIEAIHKKPLCEIFDLVFGTSTGAIIAALIALGYSIDEIHALYKQYVPQIMKQNSAKSKSAELVKLTEAIFKNTQFTEVKTGIGIVATKWDIERPMIFKADVSQAHGRVGTFSPGFGVSIAAAVKASCSAYPFFEKTIVTTSKGDEITLIDGGYCANNPTLYAIADALIALKLNKGDLRVISVGVGCYPEPKPKLLMRIAKRLLLSIRLLQKTLEINTQSMDQLRSILFKDVPTVRINDTYERPEMATDLLEFDLKKLGLLKQRGSESFAAKEAEIREFLTGDKYGNP